ncbi:MAG: carboxypeptidase-like regulatory domain-containing protein [Terriglobales bacterium]
MFRKLGCFVIAMGLVIPAYAAERPGSISGYVRSAAGAPQMGAVVEVIGSAMQSLKVFTDEKGFYSATGLRPGLYSIRVSAPSFLTAEHEQVGLHAGAILILNVTLSTLFDSVRLAPSRSATGEDDWKWVLRSAANRSILRSVDPSALAASQAKSGDHDLKGTLAFLAGSGSEGFGSSSDMSTGFSIQRSLFTEGTVVLRGNVGYGQVMPATVLRASYSRKMANGSEPRMAVTFHNLASPDPNLRGAALQALALTTSDNLSLGNLELNFGSEMQTVQFMGRVSVVRPFGTADFHVSPDTVVEYQYATSVPDSGIGPDALDFNSPAEEFSEAAPRMSVAGFSAALEHAHHQEISVSHRSGKNNMQFAVYSDRVSDPALVGVGETSGDSGQVLPDIFSGTFTYRGKNLDTHGARVVFQRKLSSDITATMDYSYGGVLDLGKENVMLADARQLSVVRNRHSATVKMSGTVPATKSHWVASYGWVSGQALTPVDLFNTSAGRGDPYLDMFLRQPIPGTGFIPSHMEAIIEVRNLLAQGYVPVLGSDGKTVYLVQSARTVRGGLAFSF